MITHVTTDVPDVITVDSFCSLFRCQLSDTRSESRAEAHNFWEFLYLEKGQLSVLVDGELYSLIPGELILYPPNSFHSVASSNGTVVSIISFSTKSSALHALCGQTLPLSRRLQESLAELIDLGKTLLTGRPVQSDIRGMELREGANLADFQRLGNLLELFLLDLCKADIKSNYRHHQSEQFAAFTKHLKENMDQPLSLEEISKGCALSISHLQKLCRKECGCGPVTYFISLKIGAAKHLMSDTSLNFTQIAEELGFSSVHYFSKLFKSKTGMSPSEYVKSVQKK